MSWVFSLGHVGSKGGNCQKDDPEKDENEQKPSFQLIGWKKLYFHRLAPLERTIYLYMLILSSIAILSRDCTGLWYTLQYETIKTCCKMNRLEVGWS